MPPVAVAPVVVGIYCRISIDKSARREGVEAQERWGREYVAERWPGAVVRVFVDNSLSAARNDRRPGYESLRSAVRWAADAMLSGWSLTAIADELTGRGFTGAQSARGRPRTTPANVPPSLKIDFL